MNPQPDPQSQAERVFAAFLERLERGDEVSIEELQQSYPKLSDELGALHSDWHQFGGLSDFLPGGQGDGQGEEPKSGTETPHAELLRRLSTRRISEVRYLPREQVAQGGMGRILRVRDADLNRSLAMKVASLPAGEGVDSRDERAQKLVSRFLEEAQITGQLDHPGIVPVHEIGLDAAGQLFFTMPLVRGSTLREIVDEIHSADSGEWSLTRGVGVLQKVCEAMAYAHSKGVLHRDLKPGNIMVGRFGEVYVMDWGLARVDGRGELKDIRIADAPAEATPEARSSLSEIRTERGQMADSDSPLLTMDGDVVGTPAYMSPEQAGGRVEEMGPAADVFSVGAMLYHLLTGSMPYLRKGERASNYTVLRWVLDGPPPPLERRCPEAPPELVAVCEKAMAREPERRYAGMLELASDLRAYLEGRVVRAHRTGALAEARKWAQRNRLAAALVLALVVGALGASLGALKLEREKVRAVRASEARVALERDKAQSVADRLLVERMTTEAQSLWPTAPATYGASEAWLAAAQELTARQDARSFDAPAPDEHRALVEKLEPFRELVAAVRARLERAHEIHALSIEDEDARRRWDAAIADIAASEVYGELVLEPQSGLLPLEPDPQSGLWEFAHLRSGEPAPMGEFGRRDMRPECGVVLVLLPGGPFLMGSQNRYPAQPNYDPNARQAFLLVHEIELEPFFLSKFELTQEQWERLTATTPSQYRAENRNEVQECHPVEQVSWHAADQAMRRAGLELPTEARWEYAARAGTHTIFFSGDDRRSLEGFVNLADQSAADVNAGWPEIGDWPELRDGFPIHAPVDTLEPNPFGLFHTAGNVAEWCADPKALYTQPVRRGDGLRSGGQPGERALRGGDFAGTAHEARSAWRRFAVPDVRDNGIGLRPALSVQR